MNFIGNRGGIAATQGPEKTGEKTANFTPTLPEAASGERIETKTNGVYCQLIGGQRTLQRFSK